MSESDMMGQFYRLIGKSKEQVDWEVKRLRELFTNPTMTQTEALRILREEKKDRPWLG